MHEAEASDELNVVQLVPPVVCLEDMCKLHAMVWQQQPSKAVLQRMQGVHTQSMGPAAQEAVLQLLNSPVCQAVPPSLQYVARLVKQLITAAEEQQQELSEPLLELNTALLMPSSTTAAALQEAVTWCYKTFYYSSSPSWQELQQLQTQHCQHISAAVSSSSSSSSSLQHSNSSSSAGSQPPGGAGGVKCSNQRAAAEATGWTVPAQLQQRLLQRQEALQQLLSAVHWQQPVTLPLVAVPRQLQQQPRNSTSNGHQPSNNNGSSGSRSGLITVHSSDNMFEGGTGCHMWDAGFLLAEFVLNNRQIFEGKHVLEIGCGPGLVATCLCRSGADRVLLTDGDPQTLVNCLSNISMNGHTDGTLLGSWREATDFVQGPHKCDSPSVLHQVLACLLDWDEHVPGLSADIIVGSDICYDPEAVPSLVKLLQQLLARPATAQHSMTHSSRRQESAQEDAAADAEGAMCSSSSSAGVEPGCGLKAAAAAAPAGAAEASGSMGGTVCAGGTEGPIAYFSTTKRQGSTLQLFLDECAAAGLDVQEVPKDPSAWPLRMVDSDIAGGTNHGSGCVPGCSTTAGGTAVVFQELPALQEGEGRERYVLHRVQMRL